jgi:hypothetical protein
MKGAKPKANSATLLALRRVDQRERQRRATKLKCRLCPSSAIALSTPESFVSHMRLVHSVTIEIDDLLAVMTGRNASGGEL